MPVAPECGDGGCTVAAHAATGWCLAATGAPVVVVTTLACPPGDADVVGAVDVTLIDPTTGVIVAPQAVVPCGDKDWEVNQLCDYDPGTGDLIATFIQVFEWDENTSALVITNVRADDPTIPYVPVGTVRACTDDETQTDVEITDLCYDPVGVDTLAHGWQAWIFVNGAYTTSLYFDAAGAPLIAPTIIECPDLATEATLTTISTSTATSATAVKLEDSAHASGDAGVPAWGVRNDADAVRTSADGDYSPLSTDSAGRVKASPITKSERKVDGKSLSGAGSIIIPDGVISFTITVLNKGTSTTITSPDIVGPWTLFSGQTVSHGADDVREGSNLINGPVTITTVGAAADVNASWLKP